MAAQQILVLLVRVQILIGLQIYYRKSQAWHKNFHGTCPEYKGFYFRLIFGNEHFKLSNNNNV